MNLSTKQKKTHRHQRRLVVAKGERHGGGKNWQLGISGCKLLYKGWINNKVLLYSTGNYIQYPVINHNGKEDDKEYIWITLPYIRNQHNIVNQLSVQFSCSVASDSLQPHGLQHARLLATSSRSLLKLISVESVMPFNYLVLCPPLLLPLIFPSIRVFSDESVLHIRWPKYWSFASVLPMNI